MHSSTSSSEPAGAAQWTGRAIRLRTSYVLVAALAMVLAAVELASLIAVPRFSKVEARTEAEYRTAAGIRGVPGRPLQTLVLGNSLLEAGVEFPQLASSLAPDVAVQRLVVENTAYLDWYYGLRRLIADGARPGAVVLMLSWEQLTGQHFRGSYSARRLVRLRDVPRVAGELDLSNTETSGLILSNLSAFYGLREELRKQVLHKLVPDLPQLASRLNANPPVTRAAAAAADGGVGIATRRLAALSQEAQSVGARLIVVIPPTKVSDAGAHAARIRAAAESSGVTVRVPVDHTLAASFYSDGFHLNERGATLFTRQLGEALRAELGTRASLR